MAISASTKRLVFERAKGYCEYCKLHLAYSSSPFCVEHIQPRKKSGSDSTNNLACSCMGCNGFKHTKTTAIDAETGTIVPIFNPRETPWAEHFAWDATFLNIIGLTPTGRATVSTLQLNRKALVNIRRALLLCGDHPPTL
jgi:HNH endonuclease